MGGWVGIAHHNDVRPPWPWRVFETGSLPDHHRTQRRTPDSRFIKVQAANLDETARPVNVGQPFVPVNIR